MGDAAPVDAGLAQAHALIADGRPPPRVGDRYVRLRGDGALFEETRAALRQRTHGQHSPLRCVDAVNAATRPSFEQGLRCERELFLAGMDSPQRAPLVHALFGERAVAKVPSLSNTVGPRLVERVAVIGAGTMGSGITMALVNAGLPSL